jgi:hypothetical protein
VWRQSLSTPPPSPLPKVGAPPLAARLSLLPLTLACPSPSALLFFASSSQLRGGASRLSGETSGRGTAGASATSQARLLVDGSQAGSVIGKGGEIVKMIRDGSGANVRILPVEELPPCADPTDRVVQCVPAPPKLGEFQPARAR